MGYRQVFSSADDILHFRKHLFHVFQPQLLVARTLVIAKHAKLMGSDCIALGRVFFREEIAHGVHEGIQASRGSSTIRPKKVAIGPFQTLPAKAFQSLLRCPRKKN